MFVVVDTSIFCRDFVLRGKAFQIFLDSLRAVPARLCVPDIVLDEVVRKYAEDLSERTETLASARRKLSNMLVDAPPEMSLISNEAAVERYRLHLRSRLTQAGAKFLPYPKETHQKVIEQALLRRKPFNSKGQGYRDYLIWVTLRTEMYYAPEETAVLITGNTLDFCDGTALASSLLDELERYHRPGVTVLVSPSLDAFNSEYVVPRLQLQSRLQDALSTHAISGFDLHAWTVENLLRLLQDDDYIIHATHGIEPEHADCYVGAVDTIDDLRVNEVRIVSDKRRLVSATASIAVVLYLSVSWEQYRNHKEAVDLLGVENEPFLDASWNETAKITVHFSLVIDEGQSKPVVAEIDQVDGPVGSEEINQLPRQDFQE